MANDTPIQVQSKPWVAKTVLNTGYVSEEAVLIEDPQSDPLYEGGHSPGIPDGSYRGSRSPRASRRPLVVDVSRLTAGSAAVSSVQKVTIGDSPTGGTFTLSYGASSTAPIAYNATASAVSSALVAISAPVSSVTGVAGGPYTVTFTPGSGPLSLTGSAAGLVGGSYYYKVTTLTAAGESLASSEVTGVVSSGTSGSVALSWSVISGATGYRVYRSLAAGGESTTPALLATISSGATAAYTDTGTVVGAGAVPASNTATLPVPVLAIGTLGATGGTFAATGTYYYKMTATNAAGETVGSAEVSAAVPTVVSTVPLSWPVISGATGYKIYRSTTAGGESTTPALLTTISSGATAAYTDTGTAVGAGAVPASNTATLSPPVPAASGSTSGGTLAGIPTLSEVVQVAGASGVSEVQNVTVSGGPPGGFSLSFQGFVTSIFGATTPSSQIQGEFGVRFGAGNVVVAGPSGGPYVVTFAGSLAGTSLPLIQGA